MNLTQKAVAVAEFLGMEKYTPDEPTDFMTSRGYILPRAELPESLELVQLIKQYCRENRCSWADVRQYEGEFIGIADADGKWSHLKVIDGKEVPAYIECFWSAVVEKEKV